MTRALKDLLSKTFLTKGQWKYQLLQNWDTIIGPLCTKVRIEKILNDMVVLGVHNSCWLQELYLLSPLLMKTINQNLDKPRIKKIRFKKIGIHPQSSIKKQKQTVQNIKKPQEMQLTQKQKCALEKINDLQLRDALKLFLKRCHGENR